jgi:hypothetical protein
MEATVQISDMSVFAAELRQAGFEARNLGRVGLTVWSDGQGYFFSLEELREVPSGISARNFDAALEEKRRRDRAA